MSNSPATRYTCQSCGSIDLIFEAALKWNEKTQDWDISTIYDDVSCNACEAETTAVKTPIIEEEHPLIVFMEANGMVEVVAVNVPEEQSRESVQRELKRRQEARDFMDRMIPLDQIKIE